MDVVERQVHPHIAALVVLSTISTTVFVVVIMSTQFAFVYDGRLAYISEVLHASYNCHRLGH